MGNEAKHDKLNNKKDGVVKHSIWIALLVCIGKVLGFLKQSVIAWAFGAGSATDTYYAADGYTSMVGQVMGQSVAPSVLTQYIAISQKEGEEKGNSVLYESFMFFSILGLFLMLVSIGFSGVITKVVGISYSAEQREELQKILIALCPVMLITPISGVCSAYLDSNKKFTPSKLCSIFFSVTITITLLLFHDRIGIWALVIGFVAGYLLHMIYMLISVRKSIKIKLKNPLKDPQFKLLLKSFGPMVVGNSVVDFGHLVDRIVASSLVSGSVSVLFYGQVISGDLVNAVVVTTVGTVLLTSFSKRVSDNSEPASLCVDLQRIMSILACITCLISSLYFIEGEDLIKLFFERGAFDADSSSKVFQVACSYSLGFMFMSFREVLIKVHYAFLDTVSPMINSIIGVLVNMVGSIVLSRFFGVWGIAIATSISMLVVACLSCITVKKHLKTTLINKSFIIEIIKIVFAASISVLVGKQVSIFFSEFNIIIKMGIVTIFVIIFYLMSCCLIRVRTVDIFRNKFNKLFIR